VKERVLAFIKSLITMVTLKRYPCERESTSFYQVFDNNGYTKYIS